MSVISMLRPRKLKPPKAIVALVHLCADDEGKKWNGSIALEFTNTTADEGVKLGEELAGKIAEKLGLHGSYK